MIRRGDFGWIHSYETGSTVDGPGIRVDVFMSGCLLRCLYCHNPDTWHLKDGNASLRAAQNRARGLRRALRAMDGGLTISGGEPLVQMQFTKRLFAAAKGMGLHTAMDTSGFLGARADDEYLRQVDLVLLDIKSWDPATYRRAVGQDIRPTMQFAERLASLGKPVWVRFVLVPGPDRRSGQCRGHRPFRRSDENVEWVEVLPFHQMGTFKWKAMGLDYELSDTLSPSPDLLARVIGQFREAGCRAR